MTKPQGWDDSAAAWIADMGDDGDFGRRHVLDAPMIQRLRLAGPQTLLDVGCGEGRFCRLAQTLGITTTGLDPTAAFIDHARARDPAGDYRIGQAEALPFADASFDLVVSYLSLIDIDDIGAAIPQMARVLKPGGRLLIANLTSFNTAGMGLGWTQKLGGRSVFGIDRYLEPRADWVEWRGIRVRNRHRPLSAYMSLLIDQGLTLTHFDEPAAVGGEPARVERYNRAPWFLIMEWRKP
jgi:SAM-dependent methyltransferase